jgi:hypothetical protein
MRRNEREDGKGTGRNNERRWKRYRMDERGMEEGGKDREGEGWGIERKNVSLIKKKNWNCKFSLDKIVYKGCFFKFGVEVGVGELIESAPLV